MNNLTFDLAPMDGYAQTQSFDTNRNPLIVRYLGIAKRWKWLLLGAILVAAIIGAVVTMLMTPKYTAEATLEIKRENFQIVNVQGVEPEGAATDLEFYETQWGLLSSQSLAERVARELRLSENAAFFEMFGATETVEELGQGTGATPAGREKRVREAAEILLKHVTIAPERMSRLVEVKFTSPDPQLSTQIANTWTTAFIETSLERRFEATSYARKFLEERLAQLRVRMQESERDLVKYAADQRIINVPTSTTTGAGEVGTTERPLVAEDLSALNQELNKAIADRVAAQSRLRGAGGSTTEALENATISSLRTRRAAVASEYTQIVSQFEPDYPPARALADQLSELDRAISREEGRVRSSLRETYDAALDREQLLRQRVNGLEGDLLDNRGRTIQYNIFQREVDTNRQLYDALLQRYKEIGVAGGVGVNNISVVDPAKVPEEPSSPNLILNLLLSLAIGGLIGAGLALALEQIDETISDPRTLENALHLPLLGTIPRSEEEHPDAELNDPKSPIVEAYLSAQTRLGFTTDHGVPRSLVVTSTRPGEGKTTTAYALARQLARKAGRVILVDGDMRSPSLHLFFDVTNENGMSNYLSGEDNLAGMVVPQANGLSVLPAGPTPPNAAELLAGDRLAKLMRDLSGMFDHVIVDAPPVMGLADTPLIANAAEGVVFVIESHQTRTSMARVAIDRLRHSKARVLGALLTKFETDKATYGYGYEYGYGYGDSAHQARDAS